MARYSPAESSTFDETFDETFQDSFTRVRGSFGGATFQKIGTSFAIRHRAGIVNKRTARQTQSRNRFEFVQGIWRELSPTEKASYVDQAVNYPRTNSIGEVYTFSGINLQNAVNTNAQTQGEPIITTMPAPQPPPAIDLDTPVYHLATEEFFIETNPSVLPGTHSMLIYATRPVSPGELTNQSMFIYMIGVPPGQAPNNFNFFTEYVQRFAPNENNVGQLIHVALQFVSNVSFMSGLTIYGQAPIENI